MGVSMREFFKQYFMWVPDKDYYQITGFALQEMLDKLSGITTPDEVSKRAHMVSIATTKERNKQLREASDRRWAEGILWLGVALEMFIVGIVIGM